MNENRPPPQDLKAEKAVIGSCILDGQRVDEVGPIIRPADFHDHRNATIFSHLIEMRNGDGGAVDVTLLHSRLQQQGELKDGLDSAYLAEVMHSVAVPDHAGHYAEIVRNLAVRRRVIRDGLEIVRLGHDDHLAASELVQQARSMLEERAQESATSTFERVTCEELDAAKYEIEYLIDRTLVASQPCVIGGSKKSLKTSLVIDMGIALARGGFFLGKLKANRACRVGIMSGESGMAVIQETARRICRAAGYSLAEIENLVFSESLPQFQNPEHVAALRTFIERDRLEVLFIDPAYLCMKGTDAGNLFIQGDTLRAVNEVCADTGCTMVLVHHLRKGGRADPFEAPELEDIAWAGFQEWARQWILIGRREKYEPGSGYHKLWMNVGGSAGHSALWGLEVYEGVPSDDGGRVWEVAVVTADEARKDTRNCQERDKEQQARERLEADKTALCRALAHYPNGETKNTIRDRLGMSGSRFNPALASLLEDEAVVACDVTKPNRKKPYPGYKLNRDPL